MVKLLDAAQACSKGVVVSYNSTGHISLGDLFEMMGSRGRLITQSSNKLHAIGGGNRAAKTKSVEVVAGVQFE